MFRMVISEQLRGQQAGEQQQFGITQIDRTQHAPRSDRHTQPEAAGAGTGEPDPAKAGDRQ